MKKKKPTAIILSLLFTTILQLNIYTKEATIEFKIEKINVGGCSKSTFYKIKPRHYLHNFDFLGICVYEIIISGSTNLPEGTWLIITLLYNDTQLPPTANRQATVEADGTFKAATKVFKGENKIFPGTYQIRVWYKADRQDPDVQPKLKNFPKDAIVTQEVRIWDEETNLPLHLEIKRLIKFYFHLIKHLEFLEARLYEEFNKYFPENTPKSVKEEYQRVYSAYQKGVTKLDPPPDSKKLCDKDLCFYPNTPRKDFDPMEWETFTTSWRKAMLFFYNLGRNARDKCLINPFPEVASRSVDLFEALLSYAKIYEKRLKNIQIQSFDPLNPTPDAKGVTITQLRSTFVNAINVLKNKLYLLKDASRSFNLPQLIRKIHSIYKETSLYIEGLPDKIKKTKDFKKLIKEDENFTKNQLLKISKLNKNIEKLKDYAKQRKNKTILDFTNSITQLSEYLKAFWQKRQPNLNYTKFLKPKTTLPETYIDNFRKFRYYFLALLQAILQKMGNQELYISLNIEEELNFLSLPTELTQEVEERLDSIFKTFRTNQENPNLFTKSYLSLKSYGKLVTKFIMKKNLLDSDYRFERIYATHFLKEPEASIQTLKSAQEYVINHINKWFDNKDYEEELGFAYEIIAGLAKEEHLDILHKGLTHKKAEIRGVAIVGIIKISSPRSFEFLANALKDESPFVRTYAKDGINAIIENSITEDVQSLDPKKEEDAKKLDEIIQRVKKEFEKYEKK